MSHIFRDAAFPMTDNCFFRIDANDSIGQHPSLDSFTALIDQMQAMYNLSLWIGLINATGHDTITIMVHYAQEGGGFDFASMPRSKIRLDSNKLASFSRDDPTSTSPPILFYRRCDSTEGHSASHQYIVQWNWKSRAILLFHACHASDFPSVRIKLDLRHIDRQSRINSLFFLDVNLVP